MSAGDDDPDLEQVRTGVRTIIGALLAGRLSAAEGLTQLNAALEESGSQIRWWGQFGELLEGSGEFVEQVRWEFRADGESGGDAAAPIKRAEIGGFLEFLKSFGA